MNNFLKLKLPFYGIINMVKNKVKIREEILLKLRNFAVTEKLEQTLEVQSKFTLSQKFAAAQNIGLYMNTALEFDLTDLFFQCWTVGKKVSIPKTSAQHKMTFIEIDESSDREQMQKKMKRSEFGIWEPVGDSVKVPDLIVVPGLAWNSAGHRIGFGGGYYDRYLADFAGHTVSLVYDFQRVEFLPEPHDIAVKEIFSV